MQKYLRAFFTAFIFMVMVLNVQSQITGIKINGDTCSSFTIDFQALGTSSSPYFSWNFGDPASGVNDTVTITGSSPSPFPTHTFSSAGVYTVCVSLQEPGFPVSTICRTISIGLCCNGIIMANDSCLQNSIPFSIVTGASITNVTWNFNDPLSGSNNNSNALSPTHMFSAIGNYNVTANITASCGVFQINFPIQIVNCSSSNCTGIILSNDTCLLDGTSLQVSSNNTINSIMWDFGEPSTGQNNMSTIFAPTHLYTATGTYNVQSIVNFSCGIDTLYETITIVDCDSLAQECELFVPNVFTPNSDGINDEFFAQTICQLEHYELFVFNRWGNRLYKTSNQLDKWDGKYLGNSCSDGVYVYVINYQFPSQKTKNTFGIVTILK